MTPEVAAAPAAGHQPHRAPLRDALLPRAGRAARAGREGQAADPLHRQDLLRPHRPPERARTTRGSPSGASSCSIRSRSRSCASSSTTYPNLSEVVWVQEEPRNMGARAHMSPRLMQILPAPPALRLHRPARARLAGRGLPRRPHRRAEPDPAHRAGPARSRSRCTRRRCRASASGRCRAQRRADGRPRSGRCPARGAPSSVAPAGLQRDRLAHARQRPCPCRRPGRRRARPRRAARGCRARAPRRARSTRAASSWRPCGDEVVAARGQRRRPRTRSSRRPSSASGSGSSSTRRSTVRRHGSPAAGATSERRRLAPADVAARAPRPPAGRRAGAAASVALGGGEGARHRRPDRRARPSCSPAR